KRRKLERTCESVWPCGPLDHQGYRQGLMIKRFRTLVCSSARFIWAFLVAQEELMAHDRFCAGFRTPGMMSQPRAPVAGVREAPRHEIAGSGAPAVPRTLWGFSRGM